MHGRTQGDFGPRCGEKQLVVDRAFARSSRSRGVGDSRGRFGLGRRSIEGGGPPKGRGVCLVRFGCGRPQRPDWTCRPRREHAACLHARRRREGGHCGRRQRHHPELCVSGDEGARCRGPSCGRSRPQRIGLGSRHRSPQCDAGHRRHPRTRRAHGWLCVVLRRSGGPGLRRQPLALQVELESAQRCPCGAGRLGDLLGPRQGARGASSSDLSNLDPHRSGGASVRWVPQPGFAWVPGTVWLARGGDPGSRNPTQFWIQPVVGRVGPTGHGA